jgi:hypothetical protein
MIGPDLEETAETRAMTNATKTAPLAAFGKEREGMLYQIMWQSETL